MPPAPEHPLAHNPHFVAVLDRLHALSLAQEVAGDARGAHFPTGPDGKLLFEEQLVALDENKCAAMYLILRAMGARRIVEAGTSYGVSLLWILAAVTDTPVPAGSLPSVVYATENEPKKAALAFTHVREAFGGVLPQELSLLEGDLLQTLPNASIVDRSIDCMLLDIWAPLALPTLKIMLPKLRIGAVVFIDNTVCSAARYEDLLNFLRDPANGFITTTLPHSGGFEMCLFTG
ncbi:hypothetical protein P7C70_g1840, partial [Phenoliferia sp. Uapishka_3]